MATKQRTRNIALTPHFDRFVQKRIESGRYQSASEVVRESLRIMERHEKDRQAALAELNEKLDIGYQQLLRGETIDADEVFAEINAKSKAARRNAKKKR